MHDFLPVHHYPEYVAPAHTQISVNQEKTVIDNMATNAHLAIHVGWISPTSGARNYNVLAKTLQTPKLVATKSIPKR